MQSVESGKRFIQMATSSSGDDDRLLHVKNTKFLIVHRFDGPNDGLRIKDGLKNPKTFRFSNNGNIKCKLSPAMSKLFGEYFYFKNALDVNTITDYGPTIHTNSNESYEQYVFNSEQVISKNLKYILCRQYVNFDERSTRKNGWYWHLLYNIMHTGSFKAYYEDAVSNSVNVNFGVTTIQDDEYLNLQQTLQDYCKSHVLNVSGEKRNVRSFLDPTCNVFYSPQHCNQSALIGENRVRFDRTKRDAYANAISKMRMTGADSPLCTCYGNAKNYTANFAPQDSFVKVFGKIFPGGQRKECSDNVNILVHEVLIEGEKVTIEDLTISQGEANEDPMAVSVSEKTIRETGEETASDDGEDPQGNYGEDTPGNDGEGTQRNDGEDTPGNDDEKPERAKEVSIPYPVLIGVGGVFLFLVSFQLFRPRKTRRPRRVRRSREV